MSSYSSFKHGVGVLKLQLEYSYNQRSPLQVTLTTSCPEKKLPCDRIIYVSNSGDFSFIKYKLLNLLLDVLSESMLLEDICHLQFALSSKVCARSI